MADEKVPPLFQHIERVLGEMDCAWGPNADEAPGISVSLYKNRPWIGDITLVTLGLSRHVLERYDKLYRLELVLTIHDTIPCEDAASVLMGLANFVVSKHKALLHGEVMFNAHVMPGSDNMTAFYATVPTIFDDAFAVFRGSDPPTVFVWLIPIHAKEDDFITQYGWDRFEDVLVEKQPDLLDLRRDSVV